VGAAQIPLLNLLTAPFAAIAVTIAKPFLKRKLEAPDPASTPPHTQASGKTRVPAADPGAAHEQAAIDALERELAARRAAGAPAHSEARSGGTRPPSPTSTPSGPQHSSIAAELAALRRAGTPSAGAARSPSGSAAMASQPLAARPLPAGSRSAGPGALPPASQVRDRNRDGRPDYWEYRKDGRRVRELFDEDGDGRPDRVVMLDPRTEQELRVEEDTNLDGRTDTWVEYRNGQVARQRRDTDHDGSPDSWSFYRGGQLVRQEQDRTGDGFRNLVRLYENGRLVREQEDTDGDARVDRVTLYDAQQRLARRDEDRDGDGLIDTRSFYEKGHLTRREMVSEPTAPEPAPQETLTTPAWERESPAP